MKKTLIAALFAAALMGPGVRGQEHDSASPPAAAEHAAAATEHGEAHAEAEMPNEIWWKWANFALLVAGLGYLMGKSAPAFFRSRTDAIQKGIAEATRTREEAEARAADIERRVAGLSQEVERMRTQSLEELEKEGQRLRLETEASLRKIQAQSQAEIESAVKHAAHDLKAYSAKLALELAEGQIRSRMSDGAQDGLTRAFVSDLNRRAGTN